ncbi:ABC transporter permease [Diaphorobacter ruginosibacter]|uniref:ABC transporter permease n=1 Tax=Diaphorobacter ruginosibacter TaxID=1715720 RepID=A0A7G9RK29_9BURK|nr:ABC transporter permease [Diaphorobacter ruginosibacter]QNN55954.1 ABC transporter permease [Diaphorobacter ruginosibacter]
MSAAQGIVDLPHRTWNMLRRWAVAWWRIIYLGAVVLVLMLSPSSYNRATRWRLARHMYMETAPILVGHTLLAALLSLVITRIVVVTAQSYGLSRYAMEMVIRVLVLELIPLTAALFVAMRATIPNGTRLALMQQSGHFERLRGHGADPIRVELLPRVVAGIYASVTLAALSCVVALVMAYVGVYGLSVAGLPIYTRMFGHVFSPQVTAIFAFKTVCFSLAIALIPMAEGLYADARTPLAGGPRRLDSELGGLARMFAVLLLIEAASLVVNYY